MTPAIPGPASPGPAIPGPTFRDPAGSLHFEDDQAVRTIRDSARAEALEFISSPLYQRVQQRGDMVASTVEDGPTGLRLLHPRIPVPSYPWEWTPSQWLAAADLTLSLCEEALDEGWILKDATPLNILFVGSRPVLVDVLSFEKHNPARRNPEASLWLPYGQYMRTFVLPLLMNQMLSWPLSQTLFHRDGYEPSSLYTMLPWRQRLSRAAFWPITLPRLLDRRDQDRRGQDRREQGNSAAATTGKPAGAPKKPELTLHILRSTLGNLRRLTHRAMPQAGSSEWSQYKGSLTHYSSGESQQKLAWVRAVLERCHPGWVLDIGANTGEFSALAAQTGAHVVALERDAAAAEQLFRTTRSRGLAVQTIHADLARPTPAVGWTNSEATALLARLDGRFDLVLMLAVIHHLLLMEQIPLPAILELCHGLSRRHLVLEWVPPSDPMYQSLMRGRDELYGSLKEQDLVDACEGRFHVLQRQPLDNGRILFLFERQ